MIFVTVGTQLPFDRLVKAVDAWVADKEEMPAFAQIGDSRYRPVNMAWAPYLPADAYRAKLAAASLIVSHAGMGSLLAALAARKPIIAMPRRATLNEIRNEHQLATAKWLRQLAGVIVVDAEAELVDALSRGDWQAPEAMRAAASPELLAAVRAFIDAG